MEMKRTGVALALCLTLQYAQLLGAEEDVLPGWKGEVFQPGSVFADLHVAGEDRVRDVRGTADRATTQPWVEVVSWRPRTFVYHNFLSAQECDHIVNISKPLMMRSTVVGAGGASVQDNIRTSYGAFIRRGKDPVITRMERRLADWTHLGVEHQEDTQILRYGVGQKYGAHYDSLVEQSPRLATVLIYLQDTEDGGETAFPQGSEWADESMPERFGPFSECARGHVAVKPKKGMALLFYSLSLDAKVQDSASMHTGCPVLSGTKWSATKWIHTDPFHPEWLAAGAAEAADQPLPVPEECSDTEAKCADWATAGECKNNPSWMVGDGSQLGHCRHACGVCEVCEKADAACRRRNRVAAGFLPLDD